MTTHKIPLSSLLRAAPPSVPPHLFTDPSVSAIVSDSRQAGTGALFVAIRGAASDGHDYVEAAYRAGCRIFAVAHAVPLPEDATLLIYENTRRALALLSAAFYDFPARSLKIVGVTGTKGKTTTCLAAYALLTRLGYPVAYIGSNGIFFGDRTIETVNTTPESLLLHRYMREMVDAGIRYLVMEVSSQALMLDRTYGIEFETVLFTNLSPDHIGPAEHPDFSSYLAEKRKLFTLYPARYVVLNRADPHTPDFLTEKSRLTARYFSARDERSDLPAPHLSASEIRPSEAPDGKIGISFTLTVESISYESVFFPLPGIYNVENALSALAICETLGLPIDRALRHLPEIAVSGRCEVIPLSSGARAVIDYAHNEKSLEEILRALRAHLPQGGTLHVLFGSVGERTKSRRQPMGRAASLLADHVILTSDNPGAEDPEAIIREIRAGFEKDVPCTVIPDRKEAILHALSCVKPNDILLLAGKGHENYQKVGKDHLPFSERLIVEEAERAKQLR